jgi:hypothetical protein
LRDPFTNNVLSGNTSTCVDSELLCMVPLSNPYDNAPPGHFFICSTSYSTVAFSGFIHGRAAGLHTAGSPVVRVQQIFE